MVFMFTFLGFAFTGTAQTSEKPSATQYESKDFQEAVHAYILSHPEVVAEAIGLVEAKTKAAKEQAVRDAVASRQSELIADPLGTPLKVSKDELTVVEFFDYRCGYCRKVQPMVEKLAAGSRVRIVYRELPILGPDSLYTAKASLAAAKQGSYEKFRKALMTSTVPLTPETVDQIAANIGLKQSQMKIDMESAEVLGSLNRNSALAESLGIQATPTFVVGAEISAGALSEEALQSLIDSERSKAKPPLRASSAGGQQVRKENQHEH